MTTDEFTSLLKTDRPAALRTLLALMPPLDRAKQAGRVAYWADKTDLELEVCFDYMTSQTKTGEPPC